MSADLTHWRHCNDDRARTACTACTACTAHTSTCRAAAAAAAAAAVRRLPWLGQLSAQPGPSRRAAVGRAAGPAGGPHALADWDAGPAHPQRPALVVPFVDG